ncbi:MAG: carbon storage regulator [Myxococcales bacterium]|jgi:carbon storage regulator
MLMVSRRLGERIVVGDGVEIWIREIHRRAVKLAVKAPPGYLVLRGEVWDAIAEQNRAAAATQFDEAALVALAMSPVDPAAPGDEEPR